MSIYVSNLSYDVTQEVIREVFAEYGEVSNAHLPNEGYGPDSGQIAHIS